MACPCKCKKSPGKAIIKAYIDMLKYYGLADYTENDKFPWNDPTDPIWDSLPHFAHPWVDPEYYYRIMYNHWFRWYMYWMYHHYIYDYAIGG